MDELGVHHVRDGLLSTPFPGYYDRCRQLADDGIRFDLIASPDQGPNLIAATSAHLGSAIESFEAPNEFDLASKPWRPKLLDYLPRLYKAVKSVTPSLPVIGPSLTQRASYPAVGDVSPYADFGNLHNYFGGHNPGSAGWGDDGYGSYTWNLNNVAITTPGRPVITTETGYTNQPSVPGHLPEAMVARYLPRQLLEQWAHGIHRTYLYELLSSGGEDFGLLRADGSRKPAFRAVSSLMHLLADSGPIPVPMKVSLRVGGGSSDLHHLLFQKRNGTLLLALWVEASGYDADRQQPIIVPPQQVTVYLSMPITHLDTIAFDDSGATALRMLEPVQHIRLTVGDDLLVLSISPVRHP